MKISPAISINKKYHSHQRFLASKSKWRLPKVQSNRCCHCRPTPTAIAEELEECKKQPSVIPYERENRIWPMIAQPLDVKSWLTGKNPDAGKDWRQEEKGTIEDEMVGWHHWLNGQQRVILCLASWKTARLFSTVVPLFLQFHQHWLRILFLHILTNTCPFFFVIFMAILYHSEVLSYHGFYLHFLMSKDGEYFLMYWLTFCMSSPEQCLFGCLVCFAIGLLSIINF